MAKVAKVFAVASGINVISTAYTVPPGKYVVITAVPASGPTMVRINGVILSVGAGANELRGIPLPAGTVFTAETGGSAGVIMVAGFEYDA